MSNNIACPHCGLLLQHAKIEVLPLSGEAVAKVREVAFLCPHCAAVLNKGIIADTAPHAPAPRRIDWPVIRTQQALAEIAGLQNRKAHIYPVQSKTIGQVLEHYGVVKGDTLRIVHAIKKRPPYKNGPIGQTLVDIGIINQDELNRTLLIQAGKPMVDILSLDIPPEIFHLVPCPTACHKRAVPIGCSHNRLFLAVPDPLNFADRSFFAVMTGMKISLVFAPAADITQFLVTRCCNESCAESPQNATCEWGQAA